MTDDVNDSHSARSAFEDAVAQVTAYHRTRDQARTAGLIRRRLGGGYSVTRKGGIYIRDASQRHDDVRALLSEYAKAWEAREVTKADRRDAQVDLVVRAFQADEAAESESLAALRALGFDPLA